MSIKQTNLHKCSDCTVLSQVLEVRYQNYCMKLKKVGESLLTSEPVDYKSTQHGIYILMLHRQTQQIILF